LDVQLTLAQVHEPINLEIPIRARVGRVLGDDEPVGRRGGAGLAEKGVCFDEHLVVGAGLDGLVAVVLVEVVVDVLVWGVSIGQLQILSVGVTYLVSEPTAGPAGSQVAVVVVVESHVQLPEINIPQDVRVADQVGLPVVVEVVPRDGYPVAAAHSVEQAIVVVRAELLSEFRFELVVVNPDAGAVLDGNTIVVDDKPDGEVADDDIGRVDDADAFLADLGRVAYTQDGLVAADEQAGGQVDAALDVDGARGIAEGGGEQGGAGGDCDFFALCAAGRLAEGVVFGVADEVEAAELARGVLFFAWDFA
jgi:hypothetical protein